MCKYEQRSNWNQRPLKNTQIHYAVIDAFVCVILYNEIIKIKLKKQKVIEGVKYVVKEEN